MGAFFYAAKAFDVLERLDPDPEYWEGKRGACVGVFQQVVAGICTYSTIVTINIKLINNTFFQYIYTAKAKLNCMNYFLCILYFYFGSTQKVPITPSLYTINPLPFE